MNVLFTRAYYDVFQVAKDLGPGNVVVTALCDTGEVRKLFKGQTTKHHCLTSRDTMLNYLTKNSFKVKVRTILQNIVKYHTGCLLYVALHFSVSFTQVF